MKEKSCFNCLNAVVDAGYPGTRLEPPCPATLEDCKAINADEWDKLDQYTEDELPKHCYRFNPRMIEKCGNCGKEMNVEEWSWEIMAIASVYGEGVPVCSVLCQKQLEHKCEEEERQIIKEQREAGFIR
jgi:hypothetical protein